MKEREDWGRLKNEEITIKPVGYVRSDLKTPSLKAGGEDIELEEELQQAAIEAKAIRSLVSELVINPELDGILDGLGILLGFPFVSGFQALAVLLALVPESDKVNACFGMSLN